MELEDLKSGDTFRFADSPVMPGNPLVGLYEYYGHGWYGRPYSGGPWCEPGRKRREVISASKEERQLYNEYVLGLHKRLEDKAAAMMNEG